MATPLSPADALDWVFAQPRTAKIGVVTASGAPLVAPIWVARDGDRVAWRLSLMAPAQVVPMPMAEPQAVPNGEMLVRFSPGRIFVEGAYASGGGGMVGTAGDMLAMVEDDYYPVECSDQAFFLNAGIVFDAYVAVERAASQFDIDPQHQPSSSVCRVW